MKIKKTLNLNPLKMNLTSIKIPSILIASVLILLACNNKKGDNDKVADTPLYEVLVLEPQERTVYNKFPVNIQGQQQVEIRPMIDGYIERIYVDEGSNVRAGQPLFKIRAPQYEQEVMSASADINIANENVNLASMEVDKVRPLVEDNIISAYELKSTQNTLRSRRSSLSQAKTRLANARTYLGYTTVVSPTNGVIGSLPFKMGSLVGPSMSTPLTNIANTRNIHAYFSMNEKQLLELGRENVGASLQQILTKLPEVKLLLADGNDFAPEGKIDASSGILDSETGSIRIRANFPNTANLINSGSSGTILIPEYIKNAIVIPQSSTYEIQDKKFVYIMDKSGTVKSKEIFVKVTDDGKFYIVQKGLSVGDIVVLGGISSLQENMKIKSKKVSATSIYSL